MKASILAIGTELTSGQISNSNAATLSARLFKLGIETETHLTVPDDRTLILDALKFIEPRCDLLFVTGGLGPTSDDFTREVIADWAEKKLIYDQASWQHIVDRLTSRGFQVRDMQKQQCYFPDGCQILTNKDGTANAFRLTVEKQKRNLDVVVLPGPPREIDSVYKDHLEKWLTEKTVNINKKIVRSWDTLGIGESDVAYMVKDVLDHLDGSGFEIGYRVHLPYVEVKLISNLKDEPKISEIVPLLDKKLSPVTVARNGQDVAESFVQAISGSKFFSEDFTVYDYASLGFLHSRLSKHLKGLKSWSFKQGEHPSITPDFLNEEENFLGLWINDSAPDGTEALVIGALGNKKFQKIIKAPMTSKNMLERRQQYFAEMALIEFMKAIK